MTYSKIIIDNNSLVNFFNYYYFDKLNTKKIYNKILEFLLAKVHSEEIIIIDKVISEFAYLENNKDFSDIKKRLSTNIINTNYLIAEASDLLEKHKNEHNIISQLSSAEADMERELLLNKNADLYLVALAKNYLKEDSSQEVAIVSDESKKQGKGYKKLNNKVPRICSDEGIDCFKIPDMLFKVYEQELLFALSVRLDSST
jgi:hypothetical protein